MAEQTVGKVEQLTHEDTDTARPVPTAGLTAVYTANSIMRADLRAEIEAIVNERLDALRERMTAIEALLLPPTMPTAQADADMVTVDGVTMTEAQRVALLVLIEGFTRLVGDGVTAVNLPPELRAIRTLFPVLFEMWQNAEGYQV